MRLRVPRHYMGVTTLDLAAAHSAQMSEASRADFDDALAQEGQRLFAVAFAILRDPMEAEDVVQETAAAAWRGWDSRSQPAQTRAWLTTICVRQATRRRSSLRRRLFIGDVQRQVAVKARREIQGDGQHLDLDRAYGHLSPRQRAVVTLHYQYGYTLVECAELMGCSAGTVSSHLSRALATLRRELRDE
jgi:RNA polymerase sigma factor (sigma-70 family)